MTISRLPPTNPSRQSGAFGVLGLAGLLLAFKEGIPAIGAPFTACHGLWDTLQTVHDMDNSAFLGIIMWVAMLVASTYAAARAILLLIKRK